MYSKRSKKRVKRLEVKAAKETTLRDGRTASGRGRKRKTKNANRACNEVQTTRMVDWRRHKEFHQEQEVEQPTQTHTGK